MAEIMKKRVAANIEGDFVVFLIGMRINKPWKPWKWLPPFIAMPRMLRELSKHPEMGLLGVRQTFANPLSPLVIQYWRSFEQLEAFARSKDATHFPAWVKFNKAVGSNGDVGIWHETFLVPAGQYEAIYNNMPRTGLGAVAEVVPAAGRRESARGRIEERDETG
ncbi:MAG: DUF4188 domain-containing protein [Dehalococcoidia bacterium]